MINKQIIFTIGTGLRSAEDFIETLLFYGVGAFIDVRSLPRSKMLHFNRAELEELLAVNGLEYHFLGRELGGFRKGGYAAYTDTDDFMKGVSAVESIAMERTAVIACSEHFPWKCHRRWIARELHKREWTVEHIIDKGKLWIPA